MCNTLNTFYYPKFFNNIETIQLEDKLANFLGTFEKGYIKFSYTDWELL